ncbi:Transposase [Caenorhabditis elegans]|uniref:Transposase n=1 Tax=Caenorhabditis elegans TaxID=6239 RepID=F5GUF3_CAEEL|nr:Transposase [Caenorhabditis elegans]CCA65548.1 Transposase [Caenorhabditis elegans]|eukprot:NP_001256732.1 Uncharacterized protein CELE_F09C6.11 [Caenorhabditis elegans]
MGWAIDAKVTTTTNCDNYTERSGSERDNRVDNRQRIIHNRNEKDEQRIDSIIAQTTQEHNEHMSRIFGLATKLSQGK